MGSIMKALSIALVIVLALSLFTGCGKKDKEAVGNGTAAESSADAGETGSEKESGEADESAAEEEVKEAEEEKPANIPGLYDLWTMAVGSEDNWTELPHDQMSMTGYIQFNEDHSGKMGQGVSGTESSDFDINWDDDGGIEVFGNKLYTWELKGDVMTVNMGENAIYYYVRQGVDGATAYNDFKEGKGLKDAAALADSGNGEDDGTEYAGTDDNAENIPVPAGCMYRVCAVDDMGKLTTGEDLKKWGYDKYWIQSQEGSKIDFDLGTSDLHDGDYYLDDMYGAITKYTDITYPLYPYRVAADGDIIFIKTKRDSLILAREGADADAALKKAGDFPKLKVKDGDVSDDLTGYAPTPRDKKYPMKGGNIYFDPVNV